MKIIWLRCYRFLIANNVISFLYFDIPYIGFQVCLRQKIQIRIKIHILIRIRNTDLRETHIEVIKRKKQQYISIRIRETMTYCHLPFSRCTMYIYFFMAAKEQVPIDLCFIGSRVCWSHRIKMTEWKSFSMEDDMCTICFSAESAPEFPRKREIDELCSLSPFPTPSGFTHRPPQ